MQRVLLDDLDDPLHAQARVVTPILGFHEARLHVPARLRGDRLLLEGFVRQRSGEAERFAGDELFEPLFLAGQQVLDDLLGGRSGSSPGTRCPCARGSLRFRSARARRRGAWSVRGSRTRSSEPWLPARAASPATCAAVTVKGALDLRPAFSRTAESDVLTGLQVRLRFAGLAGWRLRRRTRSCRTCSPCWDPSRHRSSGRLRLRRRVTPGFSRNRMA